MGLFKKYLKPFFGRMAIGFAIKVAGTLAELMLPYILTHILKKVVLNENIYEIILWGGIMIFFSAMACVCNIVANRMAAKVSKNFAQSVRQDLFIKTLRLSAVQTDDFTIPSLESRITTDTYNVHHFTNMMQRLGVRAPIMLIGGLAITLFMDAYLSLAMIALLPFIFVTVYFISRKGVPLYTRVQKSVDGMIRVVREDLQGIRVIKALSRTDYEHKRYDRVNKNLIRDEVHAGMIMGTVNPIMTLLMNVGIVAVIALSASRVSKNLSDPETVIAFMQYFTLISMAMMSVTRMFVMYTKSAASAGRINEILQCEDPISVKSKEQYPDISTDAHIMFDNVSFSYKGKKNNLSNISFSVKKGGSVGIIGATGSGKSTIVKLLLRFYDTDSGNIYINGENIRTIDKPRLYKMFGSCQQNDFLYADTIEENIKFGRDVSFEQVVKAARIAQADDFINAFPEGYNHMLSPHGTNISGGQKQRVLMSRALAARPDILILDDSSSALDYRTDAMLRIALAENLEDMTLVTIAQRVSSVKDSDVIIVIDEGEIIGAGTHDYLLEYCQPYKEISDSQMGGAFID